MQSLTHSKKGEEEGIISLRKTEGEEILNLRSGLGGGKKKEKEEREARLTRDREGNLFINEEQPQEFQLLYGLWKFTG